MDEDNHNHSNDNSLHKHNKYLEDEAFVVDTQGLDIDSLLYTSLSLKKGEQGHNQSEDSPYLDHTRIR